MQPEHALIGDSTGVDLPEMVPDDTALKELRNKAKYSRSKEYKELKTLADTRIEFYQKFLPNGQPVGTTTRAELQFKWELANMLIAEFNQLFSEYEGAEELLKETLDGL